VRPEYIRLPQYIDSRGVLVVCESGAEIDFPIARAFWIVHTPASEWRGGHAHKECHQFLIALHGSLHVVSAHSVYFLNSPFIGLCVPPLNNIKLTHFTPDTVLLALCSHPHDKDDYIYD